MIKVKDGYAKLIGTTYSGSVSRVLLSNGGDHILGNSNGNIPLNNGTVNTNLNADMLDGLHIHAGRNNEVNKIVRTDVNGFLLTGWINTTSGNIGTGAINKIYCSNDDYIRYKTPANFFPTLANSGNNISITIAGLNRTLTVGYASNTDTIDGYHANNIYNAPSFTVNNSNTSNTYILLATITIGRTLLDSAEFTILFQNRECLDKSSFILSGAIRRNSITSIDALLSYITLHTETPRNIYLRSDDGVTFMVYIQSATNTYTTYYRAIPIVDSGNITYSNIRTTSPISGSILNITATKGGNVNYASSASDAEHIISNSTSKAKSLTYYIATRVSETLADGNSWCKPAGVGLNRNSMILRMNWFNPTYGHDIFASPNTLTLWHRSTSNNTATWREFLDSINYTTYTVKKDGTGASGTWGINITGNAATASKATTADTAGALYSVTKTDPGSACSDGQNVKWFNNIAKPSDLSYAGTNAGFPVTNNANGILWLGTHSGPHGWQIGFSSNSRIYARYINNNIFPTTANGGSWNKIAWTSDIPTVTNYWWANVKISNASNTDTLPTFGFATIKNRLSISSSTLTKTNPTHLQLVINGPSLDSSITPRLADYPGIGFHMPSRGWGSLIYNGNITAINLSYDGYINYFGEGFKKNGSDNTYVLLGGGGHKLISDFATASHTHKYAGSDYSGGAAYSANKLNSRGSLTAYAEGSTTMGESGVNFYTVGLNGYPAMYGNLLHIYGKGASQLLAEWCGNSNLGHLYYRSKRDNSDNGWTAWSKVAFVTDNVATASKWATARTLTLTGSVTGSVSFDGSGNVSLATKTNHTHTWANIENKPSTFTPSSHTHTISNITNLQAILDGKAAVSHTHDYLPLSGGTMTGLIIGNNKGGSWILGRSNAAIYQSCNNFGYWHPVIGFKTKTGSWEFGSVGNDFATFSWGSDSDYNSGNNITTQVNLRVISGTIALTSEIPTKASWNYDDVYSKLEHTHDDRYYTESEINSKLGAYLPLSGGIMTGNITYTGKGTSYIGNGENDAANKVGGALNNLVIASWLGVSFTTSCAGQTYTNKNAVSINCRNGYVYADTFVGTFNGNASSATKLTSSAGSTTLPIYFSNGKPVACTASSVFSNLSNSGNNISVTVAGLNRTLTVGYAENSNTVDGYHQDNTIHYVWSNTYTLPVPEETWYLKIKTANWSKISNWICVKGEGDNKHSEYVINTGARSTDWWAYGVKYNGTVIDGCTKLISSSCDTYIRLTSDCTSVTLYATFIPASVTNDLASSYTTLVPGLNAPTFYGNATSSSKWMTARTITLTGSVTGSVSIDGSNNVTLNTTTNHTHAYLPLSGGTMTGQILKAGVSSNWINGRIGAMIRMNSISQYSVFASIKTTNGSWEIGTYDLSTYVDNLLFSYCTDTDFNNGTNGPKTLIKFYLNGTIGASITGNAATATALTSSAGSSTMPVYFSEGKPVACDKASIFSNLSNNGNDISITIAGLTRTLTVGYALEANWASEAYSAEEASNADTVDGYHASDLVKFYLSPMASNASADSAKDWFVNTMPSGSGAIVYNVPGSEKTIIAGKSTGSYGHMLQLNYDDNYLRILRYSSGSWETTDWEKISAGYADFAESATTASKWTTARTLTIGNTSKAVDGSTNVSWTLAEIGITTSEHIHTLSLATDTGNSSITLSHGGKYKLTAGGSSIIFTLPTDNNTAHTKFAWTNGSTAGPTGSLSGNHTAVSFPAIPSATASISGIVTTGTLTFAGNKTFNGNITLGDSSYLLKRAGCSVNWVNGRNSAIVKQTSASNYSAIISSKTINGSWEIGNYTSNGDNLYFTYIADTDYNNSNNVVSGQLYFNSSGCVYASHFYENSDIRYKRILKNLLINSNTIANLPLFDFEWIENNTIGTGTSALAVLLILPNLVSGTDKLTLDYGVLGTIAGITACKELVKVNIEIFTLKSELLQLREKVKLLEDKLLKYTQLEN